MKKVKMKINLNLLIRILFIISSSFFTILLSNRYNSKIVLIGAILTFLISIFIDHRYLKKINFDKKNILISFFMSIYSLKYYLKIQNNFIKSLNDFVEYHFGIIFDDFILLFYL